jgi:hypothetical protein
VAQIDARLELSHIAQQVLVFLVIGEAFMNQSHNQDKPKINNQASQTAG